MSLIKNSHISVLMSVYNGEHYILRALMSLLAQTYSNFEIILIDDGSTDNTVEIISKIKDDRLRFYQQQNIGLTKTLNKALALSTGQWIARHDADDFSIVSRFTSQINYLGKNPHIGLLGSSCFIQPEKHGIINEIYDYPEQHSEIVDAFNEYNPFVHGSMMIRRDLLEAVGGYNEKYRYVQDYELWSRLLPKAQAHNLSMPLYVRSVHQQSSQLRVDKNPIFNEIRVNYLSSMVSDDVLLDSKVVRQIESKSFYPWFTTSNGLNRSIASTFYYMGLVARQQGLPWTRLMAQAFIYSPFFAGSIDV